MWFCLWKIHELLIRFNWFEESGKLNLKEDSYTTSCSFILEQTMSEIDAEIEQWSIATFHWIELSTALNTNWNHVAIFRNSFLESIITLTKANCWYILEMNDNVISYITAHMLPSDARMCIMLKSIWIWHLINTNFQIPNQSW